MFWLVFWDYPLWVKDAASSKIRPVPNRLVLDDSYFRMALQTKHIFLRKLTSCDRAGQSAGNLLNLSQIQSHILEKVRIKLTSGGLKHQLNYCMAGVAYLYLLASYSTIYSNPEVLNLHFTRNICLNLLESFKNMYIYSIFLVFSFTLPSLYEVVYL